MRGYAAIGLHLAKCPSNVGHVLRAAQCYGAAMVAVSGKRYKRHSTDTSAAYRHLPLVECEDLKSVIPFNCVPVAIERIEGAINLVNYVHPEAAFYVFGAEDQTLGKSVLSWCRDVVYVPTSICMNLSACANVILYDRAAKAQRKAGAP